ncbi:anti-sigma regulatory factor (Ser/Thr protein kinase) [Actinomadura coerulea]|uniref:Anti-sigma regulatory factor (Ser/Thr protein kinase) n=1 Tax=Actinomadura coerulea TaxID=46159 RepID=A0A7X0G4A1_9ACTN|nr:ATP-binding protein [Actinomadura coerulea]MBB6399057.1 anti-sigma regulatory factor (Ser/Thr protein kinase) [Actinomadura coerulea]
MTKAATMCEIPWRLEDGGCAALPLPADDSIAHVARSHVTALLSALGLSVQDVHDIKLMVSELATNVLQHALPQQGSTAAELWVYQRAHGHGRDELVVKAFDTHRDWRPCGTAPHRSDHGRGLKIVELLTRGRWGHHPSRSRLRTPAVRGKATWFALPLPHPVRRRDVWRVEGPYATKDLQTLLVQRGLGHFQPAEDAGEAALTDGRGLTVWCESARFRWRTGSGQTGGLPVTDITEACERIVELCESSAA